MGSFTYATDAHVVVAKLEAEGIQCFLDDENLATTQHFLSNAIGGIKVKVKQEDYIEADKIFRQYYKDKNELEAEQKIKLGTDYKKVYEYCPQCESSEVYRKKGFTLSKHEYKCADCGHTWKQ